MQKIISKTLPGVWLFALLFVTACSSPVKTTEPEVNPARQTDSEQPPKGADEYYENVAGEESASQAEEVADSELTPELLFRLMLAEISGQRGHINVAVKQYLEAAKISRNPEVIERAARIAVYARDNESALQAAQLWTEVTPNSIEAHQVAAAMNLRTGNTSKAHFHLETVINLSKQKGKRNTFMLITSLLGKESDKQAALDVMQQLVASRQDNPDALYAYSQLALLVGDLENAR
ncbi:MAG: hypothetical protein PVF28_04960, partial [Thioalkalispiraceae bacterium]